MSRASRNAQRIPASSSGARGNGAPAAPVAVSPSPADGRAAAQQALEDAKAPLNLLRLLWRVHHGLQSASKRMERDLGITGPQRLVVRLLGNSPGMTAGELASLLHLDPGTLSGIV